MAYDEKYYQEKRDKLEQRFNERKDQYVRDSMTLAADFQDDAQTFKEQFAELTKVIEISKNGPVPESAKPN